MLSIFDLDIYYVVEEKEPKGFKNIVEFILSNIFYNEREKTFIYGCRIKDSFTLYGEKEFVKTITYKNTLSYLFSELYEYLKLIKFNCDILVPY